MKTFFFYVLSTVCCLLTANAETNERVAKLVYEDFESKAPGEVCGWNDYSTIKGDSLLGVTGATASPFDGGCRSYMIYRAYDQTNGWALLEVPRAEGKVFRISIDLMVPCDGAGSFQIHNEKRSSLASLRLDGSKRELCMLISRRKWRRLLELEPHIWYRLEMTFTSKSKMFNMTISKHVPKKESEKNELKRLPCVYPGERIGRLKIDTESGKRFYFDNLNLEALK